MKNIIKSLLLTAAIGIGSAALADGTSSYMYWMLSDMPEDTPAAWTYAKVKVVGAADAEIAAGLSYLTAYTSGAQMFGKENDGTYDYISSTLATIGSQYLDSSYKFIVELYNDSDDIMAYSAAIMGNNVIAGSSPIGLTDNAFGGAHIPEPTSGLLALLGFGVLALRRRRI